MAHVHDDHDHAPHAPTADGDDLPHHGAVLEEPRSPVWLPYLGAALLGVGVVWWLSTPNDAEERAAAAASASASASASAAAPEAAPAPSPMPTLTAVPAPPRPVLPNASVTIAPTVTVNPKFKKPK